MWRQVNDDISICFDSDTRIGCCYKGWHYYNIFRIGQCEDGSGIWIDGKNGGADRFSSATSKDLDRVYLDYLLEKALLCG